MRRLALLALSCVLAGSASAQTTGIAGYNLLEVWDSSQQAWISVPPCDTFQIALVDGMGDELRMRVCAPENALVAAWVATGAPAGPPPMDPTCNPCAFPLAPTLPGSCPTLPPACASGTNQSLDLAQPNFIAGTGMVVPEMGAFCRGVLSIDLTPSVIASLQLNPIITVQGAIASADVCSGAPIAGTMPELGLLMTNAIEIEFVPAP